MGGDVMKMLLSQYGGQGLAPLLGQLQQGGGLPGVFQQPQMPMGYQQPQMPTGGLLAPPNPMMRPSPRDQFYTRLAQLQAAQAAGKKK